MPRIRWVIPLALALCALFYLAAGPASRPRPGPAVMPVDDNPDPRENPQGRRYWEWLRLHDPASGRIPADIHRREMEHAAGMPRRAPGEVIGGMVRGGAKAAGWTFRGPWNIGGRTRALALDVTDPAGRTLLAGGVSGGMWRSTDDGASWSLTTGSSQLHSVSCVAQDTRPGHRNVWYYGTGEAHAGSPSQGGDLYRGDGIFKSTDGGSTWNLLPATSTGLPHVFDKPFDYVWRLVTNPANPVEDEVYAATWGVIYRSLDGGSTWNRVLGDPDNLSRYTDLIRTEGGIFYATLSSEGGQAGIFRSPDGQVWTEIGPAGLIDDYGRITMAAAPSYENVVYFLVSNPESSAIHQLWRYFYESGDGSGTGGLWTDRSAMLDKLPYPYGGGGYIHTYSPQRGYNMLVDVDPTDYNKVFIGGVHLWRSTNGFASETASVRVGGYYYPYPGRIHHADVHLLVRAPGSVDVAYTASDGGVHKTTDLTAASVTWTSLNNGYNTTQFYTVAQDDDLPGNSVVIGGTQDNGTLWTASADGEAGWKEIFGGDGAHCAVLDAVAGDFVVSYYRANIWRVQIDGAGNQLRTARLMHDLGGDYLFINPMLADPQQETAIYVASSNGVWRNSDITAIPWGNTAPAYTNWVHLTGEPAGQPVSALGANAQPGHALYYGTSTGGLFRVDGALTAAAGTMPVPLHGTAGFPAGAYLSDIAVHPEDGDKVLVSFGNYGVASLWYTQDGGATWTDVEANLGGADGPSVRSVVIVPDGGADLWLAGTSTGIYSTFAPATGPVTWVLEAPQAIGNVIVDDLAVRLADRRLVAGTHGRGIFSVTVPEVSGVAPARPAILAQNVPNPFNPVTEIPYTLAGDDGVRLTVHDVAGRLVRVLVDGRPGPGEHAARWDGTDASGRQVAAGVYLYRLEAGLLVEQKKMTLVK